MSGANKISTISLTLLYCAVTVQKRNELPGTSNENDIFIIVQTVVKHFTVKLVTVSMPGAKKLLLDMTKVDSGLISKWYF